MSYVFFTCFVLFKPITPSHKSDMNNSCGIIFIKIKLDDVIFDEDDPETFVPLTFSTIVCVKNFFFVVTRLSLLQISVV